LTINGVKPRMASVSLNEEPIRSEDLFVVTNEETIKWSAPGGGGTEIIVVNAQQSFIEEYKQITQSSKSALVLVNQKHNRAFNELRDISIKTPIKELVPKAGTVVFVLTQQDTAPWYSVNINIK